MSTFSQTTTGAYNTPVQNAGNLNLNVSNISRDESSSDQSREEFGSKKLKVTLPGIIWSNLVVYAFIDKLLSTSRPVVALSLTHSHCIALQAQNFPVESCFYYFQRRSPPPPLGPPRPLPTRAPSPPAPATPWGRPWCSACTSRRSTAPKERSSQLSST